MNLRVISCLILLAYVTAFKPVILLHGVLTGSDSMLLIENRIKEIHPDTIVYNIDRYEGWSSLEPMWRQVINLGSDIVNISSSHPEGVNLIGYSQGGLIARVILQTFLNHTVDTFISLSAPQGGQYGAAFLHLIFPGLVRNTAYELFYSRVGQHTAVGNYWNDPYHQNLYYNYSVFLPYVNNVIKSEKSKQFRDGLLKLNKLVFIGGPQDQVITPWQSSQFGYYDDNETVIELKDQDLYKADLIGLRTLDTNGRLKLVTVEGCDHFMWHKNTSVVDNYILPYLN